MLRRVQRILLTVCLGLFLAAGPALAGFSGYYETSGGTPAVTLAFFVDENNEAFGLGGTSNGGFSFEGVVSSAGVLSATTSLNTALTASITSAGLVQGVTLVGTSTATGAGNRINPFGNAVLAPGDVDADLLDTVGIFQGTFSNGVQGQFLMLVDFAGVIRGIGLNTTATPDSAFTFVGTVAANNAASFGNFEIIGGASGMFSAGSGSIGNGMFTTTTGFTGAGLTNATFSGNLVDIPQSSPILVDPALQPAGTTLGGVTSSEQVISSASLISQYNLVSGFTALTPVRSFSGTVSPGGATAVFSYYVSGLSGSLDTIRLTKLNATSNTGRNFAYTPSGDLGSGQWRLRDLAGNVLAADATLDPDATYQVVMAIRDGDGNYDLDGATNGAIQDPQVLASVPAGTTDSSSGGGGGGGGGCAMNPAGGIGLEWLLLAGAGLVRLARRRG